MISRTQRLLLLILLLAYWAISVRHLSAVPRVYEDEPWQASTGWKLAREGVFGSDLFAGLNGMERDYYGYMPLHPLLLAAVFRAAGVGLFQARFEPVALGLLGLALTFALGRRLFHDARVGLLAALGLLAVRTTGVTPIQITGILWLDIARIARYDMLVPVLGLAALHAYLEARENASGHWYFVAGMLAGLSGLGHLYGVFWPPALLLLAAWDRCGRRNAGLLVLGFFLPWLPYAAYVLRSMPDWQAQTRGYAERFDLLDPGWYLENLLREPARYGPGLGAFGPAWLLRPGFWSAAVALPATLAALAWRAWRRADHAARALSAPLLVLPPLFALLLRLKLANYLVAFAPLAALAGAWGAVVLWDRAQQCSWARPVLAVLLSAILVEGAARLVVLEDTAAATTPYGAFIAQVRGLVPEGARVLALHNYWFGLEDHDYRSFIVPIEWSDPAATSAPLSFAESLDTVAPDVVLLDERMGAYFAEDARSGGNRGHEFEAWLAGRGGRLLGTVADVTYGQVQVYAVESSIR